MLLNLKSLRHLMEICQTQQDCIDYLEKILWMDGIVSPFDAASRVYKCKEGRYRCKNSGKYFNVLKGTMFENTKICLKDWFYAIWKISTSGSGITSVDLGIDLGVTQKTAWFMLHRIRACCEVENNHVLSGVVETDESFIGGKNKNRHKSKKIDYKNSAQENPDKSVVLGMYQRGGKMTCKVIRNREKVSIQPEVMKYVSNGANLITDQHTSYTGLHMVYKHDMINHSAYEYVSLTDRSITNNHIEGTWRILKRSVSGTYCHVSDKHLQVYIDEFTYRFNLRGLTASDRFHWLLANSRVRTAMKVLLSKLPIDQVPINPELATFKIKTGMGGRPVTEIEPLTGDLSQFKRKKK